MVPAILFGLSAYFTTRGKTLDRYFDRLKFDIDYYSENLHGYLKENILGIFDLSAEILLRNTVYNKGSLNALFMQTIAGLKNYKNRNDVSFYIYSDKNVIFTNDASNILFNLPISNGQKSEFDNSTDYFCFGPSFTNAGFFYSSYIYKMREVYINNNNISYPVDYLLAKINLSSIKKIYSNVNSHERIIITDPYGIIIHSNNSIIIGKTIHDFIGKDNIKNDRGIISFSGKHYYAVMRTDPLYKWSSYLLLPLSTVEDEVSQIIVAILLQIVFYLFIVAFMAKVMDKIITEPILALAQYVKNDHDFISENFNYIHKYDDELNVLLDSFKERGKQIRVYIDKLKKTEERFHKAQFEAFTAQLNPHFIYNTLGTIIWLIESGKTGDAMSGIQKLSMLLRNTMGKTGTTTLIGDEFDHVKNYIDIQQFRYQNKFRYIHYFDENILQYSIPRIILQPIVENAIYHGVANLDSRGIIKIIGTMEDDNVVIKISDNGPADESVIEDINKHLENDLASETGLGIKNVHLRLRSIFDNNYGLHYEKQDGFTIAVIVIPACKLEDANVPDISG
jgi:two-component system sensor histidine kinase YesM